MTKINLFQFILEIGKLHKILPSNPDHVDIEIREVAIDKGWRITLHKELREALGLT